MTDLYDPDRQEALSRRYMIPMILKLSSGHYAIFDERRELRGIVLEFALAEPLITAFSEKPPEPPPRQRRPSSSADDLLTELGLL